MRMPESRKISAMYIEIGLHYRIVNSIISGTEASPMRDESMKKKSRTPRVSRRTLLKTGAALAVTGTLGPAAAAAQPARQSIYESLGLKHIINATGTVTNLGGSIMPPEVVAAWSEASRHFV